MPFSSIASDVKWYLIVMSLNTIHHWTWDGADNHHVVILAVLAALLGVVLIILLIVILVRRHRKARKFKRTPIEQHRQHGSYYPQDQ